jgi:ABC-type antimicrobial peptide transport system permease subunit
MALGATRLDILRLIAGEGTRLIVLGGAVGLAAALASTKLLKSLLFHVDPRDVTSYVAVTLMLAVVALVATLLPARVAMKTDPMTALRTE